MMSSAVSSGLPAAAGLDVRPTKKFKLPTDIIPGRVNLTVVSYNDLMSGNFPAIQKLKEAAHAHGILGISDIPQYETRVDDFIRDFRKFSALSETLKSNEKLTPNRDKKEFTGYELGAERFPLPKENPADPDVFVTDSAKHSLYELVPDVPGVNKWPDDCNLGTPVRNSYEAIAELMVQVGMKVMEAIGLIGGDSPVQVASHHVGRGLHYTKNDPRNPFSCGAHKDHGYFTGLLPGIHYYQDKTIDEPEEAGLYVKKTGATHFQKVDSSDRKILYFQIGETAQLAHNDRVIATEHRVAAIDPDSPLADAERFTLAVFFALGMDHVIRSSSVLTQNNPRWKGTPVPGMPGVTESTFGQFHNSTLDYFRKQSEEKPAEKP